MIDVLKLNLETWDNNPINNSSSEVEVNSNYELSFDKIIDFKVTDVVGIAISELEWETLIVHYFPLEAQRDYRSMPIKEMTVMKYNDIVFSILKGGLEYIWYHIDTDQYYYCKLYDPVLFSSRTIRNWQSDDMVYFYFNNYQSTSTEMNANDAHTQSYNTIRMAKIGFNTDDSSLLIDLTIRKKDTTDLPDKKLVAGLYSDSYDYAPLMLQFDDSLFIRYKDNKSISLPYWEGEAIHTNNHYLLLWKEGKKMIFLKDIKR